MTLPHVSSRQLWFVALITLAVVLLWIPPHHWEEARSVICALAEWAIQESAGWLVESTARAWLLVGGGVLAGVFAWGYVSLRKRVIDMESRLRSMEFETQIGRASCRERV